MNDRPDARLVAVCAILAVLCLVIYAPGLSNGFVWDDELYITRNPAVSDGVTPQSLFWAVTTFHAGNWHPLTWISHLVDIELFGLESFGHHLTSLLLHVANAALLLLVFQRLTGNFLGSALVAALFAVHPLHVESVAWVAERKDVLSTFFWLIALWVWLGWLRRPGMSRYLGATALYALALMAKPMPVTFPFLLLLLDWWPLGRFVPGRRLAVVAEKMPLLVLAGISAAVTVLAQSSIGAIGVSPVPVRLANAVLSYCRYAFKTIWPTRLTLIYPFPEEAPPFVTTMAAAAALVAVSVLVLRIRRRAPALPVGWFWFLGTLFPVIGIVQVGSQSMADRYTYVPLTGLFVMAAWGVGGLCVRSGRRGPWLAAGAAIIVALLTVTAGAQVRYWRDPVAAFTHAVLVTKDNRIAHNNLGMHYAARGDDRLAEEEFRLAIAIADDYADAHGGLAQLLEKGGRVGEAIAEYRAAIRGNPRLAEAHNNLGVLLAVAGEADDAEFHLRQALNIRPDFPLAHSNLGKLLARRGNVEEALPHFREAVRLLPETALHHGDLGAALAALGRLDEAVPSLQEALRLDPGLETASANLARALSQRAHRR